MCLGSDRISLLVSPGLPVQSVVRLTAAGSCGAHTWLVGADRTTGARPAAGSGPRAGANRTGGRVLAVTAWFITDVAWLWPRMGDQIPFW